MRTPTCPMVVIGALASAASAQLVTGYDADVGGDRYWIIDIVNDSFTADANPPTDAIADDEASGVVYLVRKTLGDSLVRQEFDADGNETAEIAIAAPVDTQGRGLTRLNGLAFASPLGLVAANRQAGPGSAPTGLYLLDTTTAEATFLFAPQFEGKTLVVRGLGYNDNDGLLYASAIREFPCPGGDCDTDLFSIDPFSEKVVLVADLAGVGGNTLSGVGVSDDRVYLIPGNGIGQVYNLVSGTFEFTIDNPPRNEVGPGGATFAKFLLPQNAAAEPRSVQIRSVDFDAGIVELFNFDVVDVDLTGWRFCSHDFDQNFRYTAASGLDGITIEANSSIFVHFNNDAPAGDPDRLDRSQLGNFALPLDQDAYGLQLFFPGPDGTISFGNASLIADHIQWNVDGQGVGVAETRTAQAVGEGLWSAVGDFIATTDDSVAIELTDLSGDVPGSPAEYEVADGTVDCPGDATGDTTVDIADLNVVLSSFGQSVTPGTTGDLDGDGDVDIDDLNEVLSNFGTNCG